MVFLAVDFLAADRFAGDFLAVDLFAVDFFAVDFLAVDFFAVARFAGDFLAVVRLAAPFLAAVVRCADVRLAAPFLAAVERLTDGLLAARLLGGSRACADVRLAAAFLAAVERFTVVFLAAAFLPAVVAFRFAALSAPTTFFFAAATVLRTAFSTLANSLRRGGGGPSWPGPFGRCLLLRWCHGWCCLLGCWLVRELGARARERGVDGDRCCARLSEGDVDASALRVERRHLERTYLPQRQHLSCLCRWRIAHALERDVAEGAVDDGIGPMGREPIDGAVRHRAHRMGFDECQERPQLVDRFRGGAPATAPATLLRGRRRCRRHRCRVGRRGWRRSTARLLRARGALATGP